MECRACEHCRVIGDMGKPRFYCIIYQGTLSTKSFTKMATMEQSEMSQKCKRYETREDILINRIEAKSW